MKKRYTFIILLGIMLYMIYLVLSYKYTEYKIFHSIQKLTELNQEYLQKIDRTKEILENKNTKAYKNKILKAQQGLKNPGEEVIFLISEEKYNKYTQESNENNLVISQVQNISDEQTLINTMTIYQKWIYLIFKKDTR